MKKLTAILLTLFVSVALVGCGEAGGEKKKTEAPKAETKKADEKK